MNRTLKQQIGALSVAVLAAFVAIPAHAASTWTASGGSCGSVGDGTTGANTCTTAALADGTAKVSAWSNTGTAGAYETAVLTRWDGGFGVKNRCASGIAGGVCPTNPYGEDGGENTEPEHAVDNNEYRDMVLFDFGSTSVALKSLTIGYSSNDSDIQVYAWTGSTSPAVYGNAAGTTGSLATGWTLVSSLTNVANWATPGFNASGTFSSSWWLIAPGGTDTNTDHFKLYSVSGDKKITKVSEPGALALAGFGLLGAFVTVRRRRA